MARLLSLVNGSIPYSSLTGITTEIVGDQTPQLGGNLDLNSKNVVGAGITIISNGDISVSGVITATSFTGSGRNLTGLTGAAASTYGSSSFVPVISVDANGRISGITSVAVDSGSVSFPTGNYGDLSVGEKDAFNQPTDPNFITFDCLSEPSGSLATTDLGVLT